MNFPVEDVKALLEAIRNKNYLAAIRPAFAVASWLFSILQSTATLKPNPEGDVGILRSSLMSEAEAMEMLDKMGAENVQFAFSPVAFAKLAQFFVYYLLPLIFSKVQF
jgi:type II secretory pathway component PulM